MLKVPFFSDNFLYLLILHCYMYYWELLIFTNDFTVVTDNWLLVLIFSDAFAVSYDNYWYLLRFTVGTEDYWYLQRIFCKSQGTLKRLNYMQTVYILFKFNEKQIPGIFLKEKKKWKIQVLSTVRFSFTTKKN